jgi:hypothetical protein
MKRDGKMQDRLLFLYKKAPAKTGAFLYSPGAAGKHKRGQAIA